LGQGQSRKAEDLIQIAKKDGAKLPLNPLMDA